MNPSENQHPRKQRNAQEGKSQNGEVPAVKGPSIATLDIPLTQIVADLDFNARRTIEVDESGRTKEELKEMGESPKGKWERTYPEIDAMVGSFKSQGQLQPVKVRPISVNGEYKYSLVVGFRRYFAAAALGWPTIRAQVEALDDKTAASQNLIENVIRENLTTYETALGTKRLRDVFGVSTADIAKGSQRTKGYLNNLLRILDRVHPTILKLWEQDHVLATTDNLAKLASLGGGDATDKERHKLQLEQWETWEGKTAGEDEEEEDKEGKPARPPKRPSTAKLKEALAAVRKTCKGEAKDMGEKCLRFAAGLLKTIPGVYDPSADKDEE